MGLLQLSRQKRICCKVLHQHLNTLACKWQVLLLLTAWWPELGEWPHLVVKGSLSNIHWTGWLMSLLQWVNSCVLIVFGYISDLFRAHILSLYLPQGLNTVHNRCSINACWRKEDGRKEENVLYLIKLSHWRRAYARVRKWKNKQNNNSNKLWVLENN